MSFVTVSIAMILLLGIVAAVANHFDKGDDSVVSAASHDCASCTAADEGSCKLHCLIEERDRRKAGQKEA